jgi:hypothetical protein
MYRLLQDKCRKHGISPFTRSVHETYEYLPVYKIQELRYLTVYDRRTTNTVSEAVQSEHKK